MRFVALLAGLVITAVVAVMVVTAVMDTLPDTSEPPVRPDPVPGGLATTVVDAGGGPAVPGVVQPAAGAACAADRQTLQTAIDTYTALQGVPPADEQALVDAGVLGEPSSLHDVRDGTIVAQDPGCT